MGALEAISFFPSSKKFPLLSSPTPSSSSSRLFISIPKYPSLSLKLPISPLLPLPRKFQLYCSAVEEITVQETAKTEAEPSDSENPETRRTLFVSNLPWSYSVEDIKSLFGQCGTVIEAKIMRSFIGKHLGFVFVTMTTREEAQAAIQKFNSYDVQGRIIKVEYAKGKKKAPSPPPRGPATTLSQETPYKLFVKNLEWRVRPSHLREFFSAGSNPVSTRVVFDSRSGKAIGYGFVSFATKEEAEAALSAFDGKELFGRPISLTFSKKKEDKSADVAASTTKEEPAVP